MNNLLQFRAPSAKPVPAAVATGSATLIDYDMVPICDIAALWSFPEISSPQDREIVNRLTNILSTLTDLPWLKQLGCSKAHLVQAALRVVVESSREMEAALDLGEEQGEEYLSKVIRASR